MSLTLQPQQIQTLISYSTCKPDSFFPEFNKNTKIQEKKNKIKTKEYKSVKRYEQNKNKKRKKKDLVYILPASFDAVLVCIRQCVYCAGQNGERADEMRSSERERMWRETKIERAYSFGSP